MKFSFECDETHALVLIDESYLNEISNDVLYSFDIFLDRNGHTELIYDFPEEKWETVWERESMEINDFCNSGKMLVLLTDTDLIDWEMIFNSGNYETNKFLLIPSGKLILVNASELIQCLAYPDLEMEKIAEINVEKGEYAVMIEGTKIYCCKSVIPEALVNNVIQI